MADLQLYHFPLSLYSGVVRLALEEKGIPYESHLVDIMKGEQYEESYMALNPNGHVPTLVHKGKAVTGSVAILYYIEAELGSKGEKKRGLIPGDAKEEKEMREWLSVADGLPLEVIIYGKRIQAGGPSGKVADQLHHSRVELLTKKLETCSENMREFYQKKLAYVSAVDAKVHNAALVEKLVVEHFDNGLMDKLETSLKGKSFLVGQDYTLADAVWTLVLQRLTIIGLSRRFWDDSKRPSIDSYLKRMMDRPSYKKEAELMGQPALPRGNSSPQVINPARSLLTNKWIWAGVLVAAGAVVASQMMVKKE